MPSCGGLLMKVDHSEISFNNIKRLIVVLKLYYLVSKLQNLQQAKFGNELIGFFINRSKYCFF